MAWLQFPSSSQVYSEKTKQAPESKMRTMCALVRKRLNSMKTAGRAGVERAAEVISEITSIKKGPKRGLGPSRKCLACR